MDDKYSAMIPRHEDTSKLRIGDVIEAKVTKVKPDGKLDVPGGPAGRPHRLAPLSLCQLGTRH